MRGSIFVSAYAILVFSSFLLKRSKKGRYPSLAFSITLRPFFHYLVLFLVSLVSCEGLSCDFLALFPLPIFHGGGGGDTEVRFVFCSFAMVFLFLPFLTLFMGFFPVCLSARWRGWASRGLGQGMVGDIGTDC